MDGDGDGNGTEAEAEAPTVFPRAGYSVLAFLMLVNTVLTVFNNGTVIAVSLRNPGLLHPMNVFILSLAVSDLMIGLCGSLVVTVTNYHGSFFLGRAACVFQGFAVNYFGLVSLCTLTLLAYERYNVVCEPRAAHALSMRRSVTGLLAVWLFCLFWAVAPLLGWSGYRPEGVQTSCSLAWEERSWSNYTYLVFYTLVCFVFPVAVIVYCYCKVLASMRKLNKSVEQQVGRSLQKETDRAVAMVLAMTAAFFACWLPYTALSAAVVLDPDLRIPPLLATMPMYFAKTSPVYNPIIYFLSNKQFRDATLEMLSCGRYVPRGTAAVVSVGMRPLGGRGKGGACGRINRHGKVLPL
ncbi:parietopsin [Syngnathoides biaculeatus]|uniref:parietopsin n=1 Tax=Syngnathoides biaculeatus TaxID=300417 RepID=UPI002ADD85CC|nr:parietopsin [Syngnathoides biaculeatus]